MKRKVWILVQQLQPKRNSHTWEPNRKALAYEPWNRSVRQRGRCRLADKLSVLSEPLHARRIGSYYLDAATSSVSSVSVARGYLRSNAQNRHPFHHLPLLRYTHEWRHHAYYNVVLRWLPSTSIYKMLEGLGGCEGPKVIEAADLPRAKLLIVQREQCIIVSKSLLLWV